MYEQYQPNDKINKIHTILIQRIISEEEYEGSIRLTGLKSLYSHHNNMKIRSYIEPVLQVQESAPKSV